MREDLYSEMSAIEEDHYWYVVRRRIITKVLRKFYHIDNINEMKSLKILEIGSGTGGNLNFFSKYFPDLQGVELEKSHRAFSTKTNQ